METRPNLLKWDSLVDSTLYQLLQSHKSNALYDIDGIIITIDRINERNKEGNPKYSFAFKANDEGIITEILDITLLTNSYFPKENITEEDFVDFKLKYLIKNNDKNLIKLYLKKNK